MRSPFQGFGWVSAVLAYPIFNTEAEKFQSLSLSSGHEMGHPPAPDVMMVMPRLSRRRLGHLGVGGGT